jgi:hypothetical protein
VVHAAASGSVDTRIALAPLDGQPPMLEAIEVDVDTGAFDVVRCTVRAR